MSNGLHLHTINLRNLASLFWPVRFFNRILNMAKSKQARSARKRLSPVCKASDAGTKRRNKSGKSSTYYIAFYKSAFRTICNLFNASGGVWLQNDSIWLHPPPHRSPTLSRWPTVRPSFHPLILPTLSCASRGLPGLPNSSASLIPSLPPYPVSFSALSVSSSLVTLP